MSLTKEAKQEIFGKHGRHGTDTGSTDVQVALLTTRITTLPDARLPELCNALRTATGC